MAIKYWLVKSEPEQFSFGDLKKSKINQPLPGRNFLRDEMKNGDLC